MKESEKLNTFLSDYQTHLKQVLEPTQKELKGYFKSLRKPDAWSRYTTKSRLPSPSPVQRFEIRIKRPESVVDKIFRKAAEYPDGLVSQSFKKMNDTIGARLVIYFLSQFRLVHDEIRSSDLVELSGSPPIAYLSEDLFKRLALEGVERRDKESGYSSVHYQLRLRESKVLPAERPWIELQVRTLTEDVWAQIEHNLGYKPDKRTSFSVKRQFQILGKQLNSLDEFFNFLFEELSRYQNEVIYKDSDPLNAENLPPVLSTIGVGCAQYEINGMLKLLASRSIMTVGELLKVATTVRHQRIISVYRTTKSKSPNNFEVVANFAALSRLPEGSEDEEVEIIKAQINFLDAWDSLKGGFA